MPGTEPATIDSDPSAAVTDYFNGEIECIVVNPLIRAVQLKAHRVSSLVQLPRSLEKYGKNWSLSSLEKSGKNFFWSVGMEKEKIIPDLILDMHFHNILFKTDTILLSLC